MVMLTRVKK